MRVNRWPLFATVCLLVVCGGVLFGYFVAGQFIAPFQGDAHSFCETISAKPEWRMGPPAGWVCIYSDGGVRELGWRPIPNG